MAEGKTRRNGKAHNRKKAQKGSKRIMLMAALSIFILTLAIGAYFYRELREFLTNEKFLSLAPDQKKEKILNRIRPSKAQRDEDYKRREEAIKLNERREEKLARAARQKRIELQGRPLQRGFKKVVPRFIETDNLKLLPLDNGAKSSVREVENIVAISDAFKDQLDEDDIIDEKMGRVFIPRDKAQDVVSSNLEERVSYNERTKQLGIITGKLLIRFEDEKTFKEREEFYRENLGSEFANEAAAYPATNMAIIHLKESHSWQSLLNLEKNLSKQQGIKRVKAEIIELGKGPQ